MEGPSASALIGLFELLDAAAFRVDPERLEVTLFGPHAEGLLGHSPGVPVEAARFWGDTIPAEDAQRVVTTLRAVASDGRMRSVEHRVRVPGRTEAWFRTRFRCEGPGPCEVVGVMQNITSEWLSERQWRETEAWLAALAVNLPFDFWICDRSGRYVLQNPASEARMGNVLGRRPEDAGLPPEKLAHWQRSFDRVLAGETLRDEVESVGPEGRQFWTRVIAPVREGEQIVGAVGVDIDITAQKQVEERLRQSLDELGRAQRTLVQQKQIAALGEMAAVVAHEVRNPLGVISNVLELMRRRASAQFEDAELVRVLREEVTRLERLVANLLDFVRPMHAWLDARPVGPVLEEAIAEVLRTEPDAARVELVRRLDPELPPVEMDAELVKLALVNVLRNAVQAMPAGGPLELRIERSSDTGDRARISIRDCGSGIPPEFRARIFEPFFTTRATGSGLGLAIVRRIVDQLGGQIEVRSDIGQGTTCVIQLPFRQLS